MFGPPRLDRDIQKTVTKRRGPNNARSVKIKKYYYSSFVDGVHPCEHLKLKWFKLMCTYVHFNTFLDVSSEDELEETWDFKRK